MFSAATYTYTSYSYKHIPPHHQQQFRGHQKIIREAFYAPIYPCNCHDGIRITMAVMRRMMGLRLGLLAGFQ
eukprot:scaffold249267_cov99-Cyclotella_meneghiniana.AAC.1